MSSSNSFNICPRCGNSNAMSARYCSRCGGELKLPEEPVICPNCRTRNTPMANFCRNCGAELKVGYATKICGRCGSEVPADQNVCACGYMFAATTYVSPVPVRADGTVDTTGVTATNTEGAVGGESVADGKGKKAKKEKVAKEKPEKVSKGKDGKVYSHKGGRAFAIVALILLLAFAYLVAAPSLIRPDFLYDFDKGIVTATVDGTNVQHYGYDVVMTFVKALTGGSSFGDAIVNNGGTVMAIIAVLVAIFALAVVVHLLICLVRIFRPRRSRKPNWCFFALALLTTIVVAVIVVFNMVNISGGFFAKVAGIFKLAEGWSIGYVLYAIPAYFWFFFLYSLVAKARVLKEAVVAPVEENLASNTL